MLEDIPKELKPHILLEYHVRGGPVDFIKGLELRNAHGTAVLAGEEIGLLAFFPIKKNGADAEQKRERPDENVEHLVEWTETRRPGAHWLIMARMADGLQSVCYAEAWLRP